jgi:5'-nucleotidase
VELPIDLVISGINRGANAGVDTFYSGTVAGAREGSILGICAISLSQAIRSDIDTDWPAASAISTTLIKQLLDEKLPAPGFWSINLPAPIPADPEKHVHRVGVAVHPMPMSFDRKDNEKDDTIEFGYGASYWLRDVTGPSDYSVIRDGGIAITAIPLFGKF